MARCGFLASILERSTTSSMVTIDILDRISLARANFSASVLKDFTETAEETISCFRVYLNG
jgi:hypothetical protein